MDQCSWVAAARSSRVMGGEPVRAEIGGGRDARCCGLRVDVGQHPRHHRGDRRRAQAGGCRLMSVANADADVVPRADLLIVGGPTYALGMSRPQTRQAAADAARKPENGVTLEPEALGTGVRDGSRLGCFDGKAAVLDTRVTMPGPNRSRIARDQQATAPTRLRTHRAAAELFRHQRHQAPVGRDRPCAAAGPTARSPNFHRWDADRPAELSAGIRRRGPDVVLSRTAAAWRRGRRVSGRRHVQRTPR